MNETEWNKRPQRASPLEGGLPGFSIEVKRPQLLFNLSFVPLKMAFDQMYTFCAPFHSLQTYLWFLVKLLYPWPLGKKSS